MNNLLQSYIRQVTPEIDLIDWEVQCPNCSSSLISIEAKSYFIFAQRHWCYGKCEACDSNFLLDVPTLLYNFWYPQILDLKTGKVYGKEGWWKSSMAEIYFQFIENNPDLVKNISPPKKTRDKLVEALLQRDGRRILNALEKQKKSLAETLRNKTKLGVVSEPTLEIIYRENSDASGNQPLLLFNCLDEYYGHSTRFLQFVYNAYEEIGKELKEEEISIAVLIPEALRFLVPDFVDEIWIGKHLPNLFGRSTFRNRIFNEHLNAKLRERQVYILKKQPSIGKGVDSRQYFHMDKVERDSKFSIHSGYPIFVFYHREDYRCWGGHPKKEINNYCTLADLVKQEYPNAVIYLFGHKYTYPCKNKKIIDLRKNGLSSDYFQKQIDYLYLLSKADCAIGIHGSHMTEMSALTKIVITLQPEFKYGNYSDDLFIIKSDRFIVDFQRFYSIFGNQHLSDITAKKVASIIKTAFHRLRTLEYFET